MRRSAKVHVITWVVDVLCISVLWTNVLRISVLWISVAPCSVQVANETIFFNSSPAREATLPSS